MVAVATQQHGFQAQQCLALALVASQIHSAGAKEEEREEEEEGVLMDVMVCCMHNTHQTTPLFFCSHSLIPPSILPSSPFIPPSLPPSFAPSLPPSFPPSPSSLPPPPLPLSPSPLPLFLAVAAATHRTSEMCRPHYPSDCRASITGGLAQVSPS